MKKRRAGTPRRLKRAAKAEKTMPERGAYTLRDILALSPDIPGYGGGKWAMYAIGCCWWTSFPEDLGVNDADLPCCPHCGSVLLQAPLEKFIASARANPAHYGPRGLDAFVAAHSRNADTCARSWEAYGDSRS